MLYSMHFFALAANKLAEQMKRSPDKLLAKLQRVLKEDFQADKRKIADIVSSAKAMMRGKLPRRMGQVQFDAFHALLTAAGERIQVGLLSEFKHIAFLEEVGIWPWTQEEKPPFPMPRCRQPPPGCGFLSVRFMKEVVLPNFDNLPPCGSVERLHVGMVKSRKGLTAVITKQRGSERPRPGLISPCQLARNQFREIVESVAADELDLLVYFSIW